MSDVFLVELHWGRIFSRVAGAAPVDDDVLTVRVDRRPEKQDDVVEYLGGSCVALLRQQLVGELRRVLGASDLRSVQAAADVDEDATLASETARLGVGEPIGVRESHVDRAVAIELRQVRGGGDERGRPWTTKRRRADLDQLDAIAGRGEALEVADRLLIGEQLGIGADGEAEDGFWRRDRGPLGERGTRRGCEQDGCCASKGRARTNAPRHRVS